MYATAERLTPDSYHALARAVYAEMALAGITTVGEFHYVHHAPGGTPYADPNAMGEALLAAAAEAGIRITLLDAAYLSSGFGRPPPPTSCASPTATRTPGPHALHFSRTRTTRGSARPCTPYGPCPRSSCRRWRAGPGSGGPPARAPVRADRRERRLPGGARLHAGPTARPARRAGAAHHRGAQHPPHRRGRLPDRRQRHRHLHVLHHRTRPRGRHRTRRGPAERGLPRSASAPTATPSSTCSRRRARWS